MLIDMHIHTEISPCSHMKIHDILHRAKERGVDGVCITDHDTMDIRHYLNEGIQENGVLLLFGMEYATSQGDFLLFGPFENLPAHLPAETLLATVHQSGGVAVAAHPFRRKRPMDERLIHNGLCRSIEQLNGRNSESENAKASAAPWLKRYELARCAGSDAHTPDEVGSLATRFFVPITSRSDLVMALKNRTCRPEIPAHEELFVHAESCPASGVATHPIGQI